MLEGDLSDFTLPDVLRLLAFTSKTGRLTVEGAERLGRIDLVDGRVRDASGDAQHLPLARRALGAGAADGSALLGALSETDQLPTDLELARTLVERGADAGQLADLAREQTLDAIFDLLRWTTGHFRFAAGDEGERGPSALDLALAVDEVLDEAAKRLEAWADLADRTGDLEAVVSMRRPRGAEATVSLPADGWALLTLIDGRRTVGDLVALAGQGEHHTRRTLAALIDEGIVEVGGSSGDGPLDRLLRDHDALASRELELGGRPASSPAAAPPTPAPAPAPAPEVPAALATHTPVAEPAPQANDPAPEPQAAEVPVAATGPDDRQLDGDDADGHRTQRSLRTKVRSERLRTDPNVDEDLVTRLIEGVEGL